MKTVKQLLNATSEMKLGNHKNIFTINGNRSFVYFSTAICKVNDNQKTFKIDDSFGSVSTTRACNAYRRELISMGYQEAS